MAPKKRAKGSDPLKRLVKAVKNTVAPRKRTTTTKRGPARKRERIDTTPGRAGGSRFVRRDSGGRFGTDQVEVGRSLAADRRQKAKSKAKPGMKDRGD